MTNINLMDKVALVAGASRGIGRATALLQVRAGASIATSYCPSESAAHQTAPDCGNDRIVSQGNMGGQRDYKRIAKMSIEKFGGLISPSTTQR